MEQQNTSEHRMERREGPKSSWIPLLLGTILFVSYMFLPGCDPRSCMDSNDMAEVNIISPSLSGTINALGQTVFEFSSTLLKDPLPDTVDYAWSPPKGATNIQFLGTQPEPGGPPFKWKNVPVDLHGNSEAVSVTYTPPPIPEGKDEFKTVDYFQVETGGQESITTLETTLTRGKQSDLPVDDTSEVERKPVSPSELAAELDGKLANEEYYAWMATTWHHSEDIAVLCHQS